MKRYLLLFFPLTAVVLVLVLTAGQTEAEPQFPVSQLTMTICSREAPAKIWSTDDTSHGRDMFQLWQMESDDPRFVGSGHDIVNWNIDFASMKGVSWGDYGLLNSNGVGGWSGKWQGRLYPASPPIIGADGMNMWLFEGRGQGHGFGAYFGLQEHFDVHQSVTVYATAEEALQNAPCIA
ncbi:MAG: hypothetical protein ACWGQW_17550, partial [bacterium]